MKFINKGDPIKIRQGTLRTEYHWFTLRKNEVIELPFERAKRLGLTVIPTTGKIKDLIVETKQISVPQKVVQKVDYTSDDFYFKELTKIHGIGKKTAHDIVVWGTKEKLLEAIELGAELPFRDDVANALVARYLK